MWRDSSKKLHDQRCFSPTPTSSKFRSLPMPRQTLRKTTKTMEPCHRSTPRLPHTLIHGTHLGILCRDYSTRGCGGGAAGVTGASSRGECSGDGWVLTGNVATLSWWFSNWSVLASSRSGNSSLTMRDKIIIGPASLTSLLSVTSCISSTSLTCLSRSYLLAGIVGEFSADST